MQFRIRMREEIAGPYRTSRVRVRVFYITCTPRELCHKLPYFMHPVTISYRVRWWWHRITPQEIATMTSSRVDTWLKRWSRPL